MEAIIAAGLELLAEVIKQIEAAQSAKDEEHEAILERVQASRAALAGDKMDAHRLSRSGLSRHRRSSTRRASERLPRATQARMRALRVGVFRLRAA
jgi:hypothetical protein